MQGDGPLGHTFHNPRRLHALTPTIGEMGDAASGMVFISHTQASAAGGFSGAAVEACIEAKRVPVAMRWFTAADRPPELNDTAELRQCQVLVALLGLDYGSASRRQPDKSYCELEWDDATQLGLTRLAYLQRGEVGDARQAAFRQRVLDAGITAGWYDTPGDLRHELFKALVEIPLTDRPPGGSLGDMVVHVERNEGVIAQVVNGPITFGGGGGSR